MEEDRKSVQINPEANTLRDTTKSVACDVFISNKESHPCI